MTNVPIFPDSAGRAFSLFPPELPPEAGEAVATYLDTAADVADRSTLQRTARVLGSLAAFTDRFPANAYAAAAFVPLAEQIHHSNRPRRHHAAGIALKTYFNRQGANARANGYVGTLLGDMPHLHEGASAYVERLSEEEREVLQSDEALPPDKWLTFRVGADIPRIATIHDKTNVESQLIGAAYAIDSMAHAPDNDQELLDRIIRAESFYSVPLEIYGFHAYDTLLRSTASKIRVLRSGHERLLEESRVILDAAKSFETEDILRHFFEESSANHSFQTAHESFYDEAISYTSTSLGELTHDKQQGSLKTRVKGLGGFALKRLTNPNYINSHTDQPSDVFGMLAVLPDEAQLGSFFADTIERVLKDEAITLTTAASKKAPLYIQGTRDFVHHIRSALPEELLSLVHCHPYELESATPDEIYQVAKFTCTLRIGNHDLPIEFQFQTQRDRVNARLGTPSHMNHHAKKGSNKAAAIIPGTPDDLRAIYSRKHDIDPRGLLVRTKSIPHGEDFKRRYLASLQRG